MATSERRKASGSSGAASEAKREFVRKAAAAQRLTGGKRTHLLSAQLDEALVTAAKTRTGISSDTELAEFALASLAVGDDFGEWLISQAGRLSDEFDLDL